MASSLLPQASPWRTPGRWDRRYSRLRVPGMPSKAVARSRNPQCRTICPATQTPRTNPTQQRSTRPPNVPSTPASFDRRHQSHAAHRQHLVHRRPTGIQRHPDGVSAHRARQKVACSPPKKPEKLEIAHWLLTTLNTTGALNTGGKGEGGVGIALRARTLTDPALAAMRVSPLIAEAIAQPAACGLRFSLREDPGASSRTRPVRRRLRLRLVQAQFK